MILIGTHVGHISLDRGELHAIDLTFVGHNLDLILVHIKTGIQIFQGWISVCIFHGQILSLESEIELTRRPHSFA